MEEMGGEEVLSFIEGARSTILKFIEQVRDRYVQQMEK
jgi:hypothetical protein